VYDPKHFGERLHALRRRQGLTLKALGDKAGMSYVTVSRIERGQMPNVSIGLVVRLAEALGVSIDSLVVHEKDDTDAEPAVWPLAG
jgi:transcriptional regulator with XRE-family HTH domain